MLVAFVTGEDSHLELDSRWSSISVFVSCLLALEVLVILTDID